MKKKLVTLMAAMMLTSMIATPVSAASTYPGNIAGYTAQGDLSMSSDSATARTYSSIPGPAGHSVKVTYTYGFGTQRYTTSASNSDTKTVSATAYSKHYGSKSLSATSSHSVQYKGHSWSDSTSIN